MPKTIGDMVLYDVEELAKLLDVQERTIRAYLKDGKLKGRKMARRWYVTEESLKAYFEQPEPEPEDEEEPDPAWQRPEIPEVDTDTRMASVGQYDSIPKG